jgi:hypothetical protein
MHVIEWLPQEEPRTSVHFDVSNYRRALAADAEERLRQLVVEEPRTWLAIDRGYVWQGLSRNPSSSGDQRR